MQKGLKTRLIIHDILKILKNHKSTLDQILINKVDNNFSSSDRNMIMSVVLTSMRHNFLIEKIIKDYSKKKINYNDNYFLLLSSIAQLLILKFKDFAVINSTVEIAKLKKPIILSTGLASYQDIKTAVNLIAPVAFPYVVIP